MSVEGAVATVHLFIILKIGVENDLHQIMLIVDSLQLSNGLPDSQVPPAVCSQ